MPKIDLEQKYNKQFAHCENCIHFRCINNCDNCKLHQPTGCQCIDHPHNCKEYTPITPEYDKLYKKYIKLKQDCIRLENMPKRSRRPDKPIVAAALYDVRSQKQQVHTQLVTLARTMTPAPVTPPAPTPATPAPSTTYCKSKYAHKPKERAYDISLQYIPLHDDTRTTAHIVNRDEYLQWIRTMYKTYDTGIIYFEIYAQQSQQSQQPQAKGVHIVDAYDNHHWEAITTKVRKVLNK